MGNHAELCQGALSHLRFLRSLQNGYNRQGKLNYKCREVGLGQRNPTMKAQGYARPKLGHPAPTRMMLSFSPLIQFKLSLAKG